jgi:hypothetical protein
MEEKLEREKGDGNLSRKISVRRVMKMWFKNINETPFFK